MRIAVLSDCVFPTPTPDGHGLGRMVHQIAEGLLHQGHDVVLFAASGSKFSGAMVMPNAAVGYEGEQILAREALKIHREFPFDVFLDNGHLHVLSSMLPDLPVVNVFHDAFQEHRHNAVLLSQGMKALMPPPFESAQVIHNTLPFGDYRFSEYPSSPPYILFLGAISDIKQPILAIEACARMKVKLVMAGQQVFGKFPMSSFGNVQYIGPVSGQRKLDLLSNARVFLQLGVAESFGLTTMEAALSGTPVVGWPAGGTLDQIVYGMNGVFVPLTGGDIVQNVCDAIDRAWDMNRALVRAWALKWTTVAQQVAAYEEVLAKVMQGARW